ncbi:transcription termination factor MTERF8, chloroplastic-like [Aegilops tauschii subsp. strangulata]
MDAEVMALKLVGFVLVVVGLVLSIVSTLEYCLPLFGSYDNLLPAVKSGSILSSDLERVVKPNAAFLRECGLGACDIARLCIPRPSLLSISMDRIRTAVACVEGLGVPRGSRMFKHALQAVAFLSKDKITANVEHLKKMFRWSDAEVGIAVSKAPKLLSRTKEFLHFRSEFLISEVGLEPAYIVYRPAMLMYSLEGRLRPRYYVVKFLKENGLLSRNRDYYSAVKITEKEFVEKFICPHKEAAPHLAKDYAAACKDEVPTRFRFT